MPRRRRAIDKAILHRPGWLQAIDDQCLRTTLEEALVARDQAIDAGALHNHDARGEIRSGDRTVDQIAAGRYTGTPACKRAADAVRKYTHALDLAYAA